MSTKDIFKEYTDLKIEMYKNRGILKKEVRSYEVSLWTLQDDFITVLKWSDVEQKGRIEKPKITLNIDGTETFSCSIPMKIYQNGTLIDNPNWYNVSEGKLIEGMRKIKVILNKGTINKSIFEFLIVNVEENHDDGILTCDITCENLAFHELGKLGYKINLSPENFQLEYDKWAETSIGTPPIANIDYWCRLSGLEKYNANNIKSRQWYYLVNMNWNSFEKGSDSDQRSVNKIYEETYTTAWTDSLQPVSYNSYTEKARYIKIENSNLYNITQELAKVFGVFCRYEYTHDDNNHIIGRKIIFYNNFSGDESILGITYPYNSSSVKRTIDSKNLTTKLFVLDAKSNNDTEDYSIMNASANASKEDYILNFDYLKKIGAITEEQYEAITPYEAKMRKYNIKLIQLQNNLSAYQLEKPKIEAQKTFYENSLKVDQECINQNEALAQALDAKDGVQDGYITLSEGNPDIWTVTNNTINLSNTNKGIDANSLFIYDSYDYGEYNFNLDSQITEYICEYDDSGNLIRISNITSNDGKVYAKYRYNPNLYYTSVAETWRRKYNSDEAALAEQTDLLNELEAHITDTETQIQELIKPLQEDGSKGLMVAAREEFEQLMGPALREGYWQPDDYSDYGNVYNVTTNFGKDEDLIADSDTGVLAGWDTELFDGEEKAYYQEGVNQINTNYVCINLSLVFNNNIPDNIEDYSLVFNNYYVDYTDEPAAIRHLSYHAIGSSLKLAFINFNDQITPVLVFLNSKNMNEQQLNHMMNKARGRARLSIVETLDGAITGQEDSNHTYPIQNTHWIANISSSLIMAYPRLKFSSLALKTDTTNLIIRYGNQRLEQYKDYYINMRNTKRRERNEDNQFVDNYYMEYFITIKPEILYRYGQSANIFINYVLSNANTAIYLDAKKISLENAYPKVSYDVNVNAFQTNISKTLYNDLARIVSINDTDLKLENVFGYISLIELDLDDIQNDRIEIKNYKNKFEDLFSKILAETEAMKYNSPAYDAAARGQVALNANGLNNTLDSNLPIINQYFDNYFNTSEAVQERLASLFDEAGKILTSGNQTLNYLNNLTTENANILNGFAEDISKSLTMKVFRQPDRPEVFKIGDIWIQTDSTTELEIARYIATADSDTLQDNSGTNGFVRTRDGKLASITGAHIDINADTGVIDIAAENLLKLQSGGDLYIAADRNVDIVGGETINIGGTQINICAVKKREYNPIEGIWNYLKDEVNPQQDKVVAPTGINLIAGEYTENNISDEHISHIFIKPDKIDMAAAELEFKASSQLNFIASTGTTYNTSVVHISSQDGVWIGSGNAVRIFSGNVNINKEDGTAVTTADGASVELNDKHLIMGFSSVNASGTNANVISMDKNQILLASGAQVYSLANSTSQITTFSTNASASGVQIQSQYIGMAVGTGNNRSIFALTPGEIKLGTFTAKTSTTEAPESYEGNFMWLSNNQIYLGGNGALTINTPNFKLQTKALESSTLASSVRLASATNVQLAQMGLVLGKGLDTSTPEPSLGFWRDSNNKRHLEIIADKINIGSGGDLTISAGGSLNITAGYSGSGQTNTGTINITSPNFTIKSNPTSGQNYFYVGGGSGTSTKYIRYTAGGVLEIKGDITADSGTFTGTINARELHVGDGGEVMTYTSSGGLSIGSGNNLLTYNNGTLTVTGNIIANDGIFNGTVYATDGEFTGTVHATDGEFTGIIHATDGEFAGELSAATGTFAGELSAATGSFAGELSAATGTFAGELSAATGSFTGSITATSLYIQDENNQNQEFNTYINAQLDAQKILLKIGEGTQSSALSVGAGGISLNGGSISLTGGNITLNGTGGISLNGGDLSLNGGSITLAGATLNLTGSSSISIGSQGTFDLSASGVSLSSSGGINLGNGSFIVDTSGNVTASSFYVGGQPVDFTVAFNKAVSMYGSWNGTNNLFTVYAKYFNNNALVKESSYSAEIQFATSGAVTSTGRNGASGAARITSYIKIGSYTSLLITTENVTINTDTPYIDGWKAAADAVKYTSKSTSVTVPDKEVADRVTTLDISDTWNDGRDDGWVKGWNDAVAESGLFDGNRLDIITETDRYNYRPYSSCRIIATADTSTSGSTVYITPKAWAGNELIWTGNTTSVTTNGGGCFSAGTLITLSSGEKIPIEQLQVNSQILAYDENTQTYISSEVQIVQKITNRKIQIIDIYLSSGIVITATTSHPILTSRGWCAGDINVARIEHDDVEIIDNLQEGDQVFSPDYDNIFIEKIVRREDLDNIPVYHIDVEPTDTYVAGGIVVHNDDSVSPK